MALEKVFIADGVSQALKAMITLRKMIDDYSSFTERSLEEDTEHN